MIIVGLPYAEKRLMRMDEITGGSPYGVSTIASGGVSLQPSEKELAMARSQDRHVAQIAKKMLESKNVIFDYINLVGILLRSGTRKKHYLCQIFIMQVEKSLYCIQSCVHF